ncbi:MAG: hypothetical protein GC136_00495, partial [Alphaproteobacteria bacterium]|nr:hypothetical protein [Alphaproteobacteria bacterium]
MTAITKDFLALAEGVRGKALRRVNFQAQYFKPHETESIPTNVRTEFIHRYFDAVDVEAQIADTVREAGDIHSDYSIGQLRERLELIGETLNSRWFGTSVINMVKRTQPLGSFGREAEILQGLEANPEIFGLKKTGGLLRHWLTTLGH